MSVFSTDLIPASDRLEAWLWNARQVCGDCQFRIHKRYPFHGSIERRKVSGMELTLFSSTALSFNKFPPPRIESDNRACIIITQLVGVRQYQQAGKVVVLQKGDTTVIDSGLPWSSDCAGDCARLYMRVPRPLMESRLRNSNIPMASRISGAAGMGAVLFRLATALYQEADLLSPEEGAAAMEGYLAFLSTCLRPSGYSGENRREPFERVTAYINERLTDSTLCRTDIASAAGISVRHLHRLFSNHGCKVTDWIRGQRLKQCWRDLTDPRLQAKSITEIAFFWGFNDSSHFSRSFKNEYGISPQKLRSRERREIPELKEPQHGKVYIATRSLRHAKAS
jgi:AraC family transcriptional regulator, positive regulator of tynA and feaB